jgi:hypothetical protein
MQITSNTTGMQAGITVAVDKEGRDFCVVIIKERLRSLGTETNPR